MCVCVYNLTDMYRNLKVGNHLVIVFINRIKP